MTQIRGRFAPTPSGSLHFGSLVAAVGSYLQSKSRDGQWFVRIDDLDTARVVKDSTSNILKALETFGLGWDGKVLYQSNRIESYHEAIDQLSKQGLTYPCSCSRKEIGMTSYAGTCRNGITSNKSNCSLRIRTKNQLTKFEDNVQGTIEQNLELELGDFIINRADNVIAYHLATVVDDYYQKITEVVRGVDLIDSTPRQIYLQEQLGYTEIQYTHLPLVTDQQGEKLSKSLGDLISARSEVPSTEYVFNALIFLGQNPPSLLKHERIETCISWGINNWSLKKVPQKNTTF